MDFNNSKPIYLQLCDRMTDTIVSGKYADGERIPSVRDYAESLGVNTNTAMKAYDELSRGNVIHNKRGLGYFVTPGAAETIRERRRRDFLSRRVPQLAVEMRLMGMTAEELMEELRKTGL